MNDYSIEIAGRTLEYIDEAHIYLVDGEIVPSITQMLKMKFSGKYEGISKTTLDRAAEAGTSVHEAIERFATTGEETDLKELRNFRFLQRTYKFQVLECEKPLILFFDETPIAAGRLDLVLKMDDQIGGADIKRTSALDKLYLAYQLNLYRIAYRQCYGIEWQFLRGIHLREDVRKFITIPINEEETMNFIREFLEGKNE